MTLAEGKRSTFYTPSTTATGSVVFYRSVPADGGEEANDWRQGTSRDVEVVWQVIPLFEGMRVPWPADADTLVSSMDIIEGPAEANEQRGIPDHEDPTPYNGWIWFVSYGTHGVRSFRKVRRPTAAELAEEKARQEYPYGAPREPAPLPQTFAAYPDPP